MAPTMPDLFAAGVVFGVLSTLALLIIAGWIASLAVPGLLIRILGG